MSCWGSAAPPLIYLGEQLLLLLPLLRHPCRCINEVVLGPEVHMGVEKDALRDDAGDFTSSVTRNGARFEVSMPWRQEGYNSLPSNYMSSVREDLLDSFGD